MIQKKKIQNSILHIGSRMKNDTRKQICVIIERVNYNLPKSENSRQSKCLIEKELAIMDALRHFKEL